MCEAEIKGKVEEAPIDVPATHVKTDDKNPYASSCRICLSRLLAPARLVCGHRFCEACLQQYWKANDEPEFVVCPLCRDLAFKIGFTEKEKINSTRDLRRKFDPEHTEQTCYEKEFNLLSFLYLRIWPILMPIIYLIIRLIRPYLVDLLFMFE